MIKPIDLRYNYLSVELESRVLEDFLSGLDKNDLHDISGLLPITGDRVLLETAAAYFKLNPEFSTAICCTSGNQALFCVLQLLKSKNTTILTDPYTYNAFRFMAASLGIPLITGEWDEYGLTVASLKSNRGKFSALYLQPTIHNPTTHVMPQDRREELASYIKEENLLVVEDDAYRFLCVEPPASFLELIPQNTVHIASLSKSINSFLKTAFIFAPPAINDSLADWIRFTSSGTSAFNSRLAKYVLDENWFSKIIKEKQQLAQSSQQVLKDKFQGIEYDAQPTAFHVWVKLPVNQTAKQLAEALAEEQVFISPGMDFATNAGNGDRFFRMALAGEPDTERLENALTRIASKINSSCKNLN